MIQISAPLQAQEREFRELLGFPPSEAIVEIRVADASTYFALPEGQIEIVLGEDFATSGDRGLVSVFGRRAVPMVGHLIDQFTEP